MRNSPRASAEPRSGVAARRPSWQREATATATAVAGTARAVAGDRGWTWTPFYARCEAGEPNGKDTPGFNVCCS